MRILALETVTASGSLALWVDGRSTSVPGDGSKRHGERLPGDIVQWLREANTSLDAIDLFAVATDPDSFTGLRVGMATMQGFAHAGRRPVVGISSLDAMAAAWQHVSSEPRLVAPCLDGQRGEVFMAIYDTGPVAGGFDGWQTLVEPRALRPEHAAQIVADVSSGRAIAVVGNGAERYRELFLGAGPAVEVHALPTTIAEGTAWLASVHPERGGAPHALQPSYLRRTEAEVMRERASATAAAPAWAFREATTAEDLAAVQALQASSFASPWGVEAFRWELEHTTVARLYVLTDSDRQVVAYCACWIMMDELHINSLAVDVRLRRRGAGRDLLTHVLREAAAQGATAATLEVRASNQAAIRLYESQGFAVQATRRDYYQDPREDALVLWKRPLLDRR